jgi:ubiquinone biosynthesis protein COQ9
LLFWLNDDSPDHAETWAFLDRRIADVMRIPQVTQRFKKIRQRLPNLGPLLGKLRRRRATG